MIKNSIIILYILLPVALLTSHSLPSAVFYMLVFSSLMLLVQERFKGCIEQTLRNRWLIGSYSILFLAVVAASLHHGEWAGANSEGALRFFLGLWILILALSHIETDRLKQVLWGVLAGGLVSAAILIYLTSVFGSRPETPGIILTTYSSIILLLGVIALFSLPISLSRFFIFEIAIKIMTIALAFYAFYISNTRTGLLAIPAFLLLTVMLYGNARNPWRFLGALTLLLMVVIGFVLLNETLSLRVVRAVDELRACLNEDAFAYTSVCVRVQLWRAVLDIFVTNPWFGLGDGGLYYEYLKEVALPKGIVSPQIFKEYFGEPHNDLLMMLAGFGIPGLVGLVLIYLVPCYLFFKIFLKYSSNKSARAYACMGLAVCLGFLFFGLTETMFRRMNTMGFYVALIAAFWTLSNRSCQTNAK